MNFKDLNCEIKGSSTLINFNGKDFRVFSYLSSKDKNDLLNLTLQKSYEDGIYNPLKLDLYFHLHLVYLYTDIEFDSDVRGNELKLFDEMLKSGLIDKVIAAIDKDEYESLMGYLDTLVEQSQKLSMSLSGTLNTFLAMMPSINDNWGELAQSINTTQFQELTEIMKYFNNTQGIESK